jgi:tripartite-type tricarboxylate transporter receptor subunit TctC
VPLVVNDLLGTRLRPIAGYDGGTALLAIERGEVDGQCLTLSSLRASQPRWITEKLVRVLVTVSNVSTPEFPDAPRLADLLKTEEERQMLRFFLAPGDIFFPWMLPPGAPPEVVATYRAAFTKSVRDPAYLAEAAKRMQSITARDGEFVQKTVDDMYSTPPAVMERVRQATNPSGKIGDRAN